MAERNIIHVGGRPGSGKSRMAQALVARMHESTDLRAEHISIGDQVRMLARGAINSTLREHVDLHLANPHTTNEPLEEGIISDILHLSLSSAAERDINTVFLEGYPRYGYQVDPYFDIAQLYEYKTPGALLAQIDIDTARMRVLKRGRDHRDRYMSPIQAWDKVTHHDDTYPIALKKLSAFSIWFSMYPIGTSGPKEQTDERAFEAAMRLLGEPLPKSA